LGSKDRSPPYATSSTALLWPAERGADERARFQRPAKRGTQKRGARVLGEIRKLETSKITIEINAEMAGNVIYKGGSWKRRERRDQDQ